MPAAQGVTVTVQALGPVASMVGHAASATLRAGARRSGVRPDTSVHGVRTRRSGRRLVVTWQPSAALVAGYEVRIAPRKGRAIVLRTRATVHHATLQRAPAGTVSVAVRALALKA